MSLDVELEPRLLTDAPEVSEPPPLTQAEMATYAAALSKLDYSRLLQEKELVEWTFESVSPALPEWRLSLDVYPHPLVQQRLLVLNEVYAYRRNRSMWEWGVAGGIVGGLIGGLAKDQLLLGVAVGGVLGAVAGRSDLLQTLLTDISTRAVLL